MGIDNEFEGLNKEIEDLFQNEIQEIATLSSFIDNNQFNLDKFIENHTAYADSLKKQYEEYSSSRKKCIEDKKIRIKKEKDYNKNKKIYDEASSLYKKLDYTEALEKFKSIPDFLDSNEKVEAIQNQLASIYDEAINAYNTNKFERAQYLFKSIEYYKDSKNYLSKIEYSINRREEERREKREKRARARVKRITRCFNFLFLGSLSVLIIVACFGIPYQKQVKYEKGLKAFEENDYETAVTYLDMDYNESRKYYSAAKANLEYKNDNLDEANKTIVLNDGIVTVSYNSDGGEYISRKTLSKFDYEVAPTATKKGYVFNGWDLTDYSVKCNEEGLSASISLKAKFSPSTFSIIYDLDGGTVSGNPSSYNCEQDIELKEPTKTGYIFKGWKVNGSADYTKDVDIKNIKENVSLKAVWATKIIKISFDYGIEDETNIVEKSYHYGDVIQELPESSDNGYVFIGWSNFGELLSNNWKAPAEDITLKAEWVKAEKVFNYTTTDSNAYISGIKDNYKNVHTLVIPSNIKEYTITKINSLNLSKIENLILPNSLTTISFNAFQDCSSLKSIIIPNSVTSIAESAFKGCTSLESITLPFVGNSRTANNPLGYIFGTTAYDGSNKISQRANSSSSITYYIPKTLKEVNVTDCETLPRGAFSNMDLTKISLPNNLTTIGDYSFLGCTSLKEIELPEALTTIGISSFNGCSLLDKIKLGSNLTSIGNNAFEECTFLKEIELPESITNLGSYVFKKCVSLKDVTINSNITALNQYTFAECTSLKSVKLSNSITSIQTYAFYGCTSLNNIILPEELKSISDSAFSNCTSLQEIIIPNSVTTLGFSIFNNCISLESISLPFIGNTKYDSTSSLQYPLGHIFGTESYAGGVSTSQEFVRSSNIKTTYSYYIPRVLKNVTITNTNYIQYGAFDNCSYLKNITIQDGVEKIATNAFRNCSALQEITIPNSVLEIEGSILNGCSSLNTITLPFVGKKRVNEDDLNQYTFGYIFGKSAYTNSELITQSGYISSNITTSSEYYYIPKTLAKVVLTDCEYLPYGSFDDCKVLTDIILPNNLKTIGIRAFELCQNLRNITIPNTVTSIGYSSFITCSYLEKITLGNSVTTIGSAAFYFCNRLEKVYSMSNLAPTNITIGTENQCLIDATWYYYSENGINETRKGYWWYYNDNGTIVEKIIK